MQDTQIKEMVARTYAGIAEQSREANAASCCGVGGCSTVDYTIFAQDYSAQKGYVQEADLGLGCGIPTEFAQIREGDTVIDLGSGAGNDCFVARAITGPAGKVIGIDMTPAMIDKARMHADTLGFNNVEFRLGDIEALPVAANRADVVISNCVLNLVPNKRQAFAEMFRVLKPGGHFSVSDIVLRGDLPEALRNDAEMYAGCVSGAIQESDYLALLSAVGFADVSVQRARVVDLPDDILSAYLTSDEIAAMRLGGTGIVSVTVYGKKPIDASVCSPSSGCC
ncbi:MAG: arsenite methyltransferase [Candidatus Kapabacteria bacterium]|nr:arsenite methyltransferase [Candidatus Kapabacteria bacterium]